MNSELVHQYEVGFFPVGSDGRHRVVAYCDHYLLFDASVVPEIIWDAKSSPQKERGFIQAILGVATRCPTNKLYND